MDREIRIPISALLLVAGGIIIGVAIMLCVPHSGDAPVAQPNEAPIASAPVSMDTSAAPSLPPPVSTTAMPPPPVSAIPTVAGRHMEYSESTSGYPIAVGRRAVDSTPEGFVTFGSPVLMDENGAILEQSPRQVGRNGLVGNPAVDPPSSRGAAYGRAYDWQ